MNGQQNSGNLITRTINTIKQRRDKILSGNVNCIPSPYSRFSDDFVGIEQGRYYLVTANQKGGKTQFASNTFIFHPILYSYYNGDKVRVKIFYYPLEETPEAITLRFMSFLIFKLSNETIKVSPTELRSTKNLLDEKIIGILESEEYRKILDYYESCIEFRESANPTGCWKDLIEYANNHGKSVYKTVEIIDKDTGEITTKKLFDYYVPNDPNEYVIILYDHISLISNERGMSLRETINKLSEYMVALRNKYNYIPVVIQQQSQENQNNEAVKLGRLRPSVSGLSDSKYCSRDCDLMLGLFNPYSFELNNYLGYDITKLKGNIRFLEIVVNRHGNSNGICPLLFIGETCTFKELPLPTETIKMDRVYSYLNNLRSKKSVAFIAIHNKLRKVFNLNLFIKKK